MNTTSFLTHGSHIIYLELESALGKPVLTPMPSSDCASFLSCWVRPTVPALLRESFEGGGGWRAGSEGERNQCALHISWVPAKCQVLWGISLNNCKNRRWYIGLSHGWGTITTCGIISPWVGVQDCPISDFIVIWGWWPRNFVKYEVQYRLKIW